MTNSLIILSMASIFNITIRLIFPSSIIPALLFSIVFVTVFYPKKDDTVSENIPLTSRAIIKDLEHFKNNSPPESSDYLSLGSIFDTMSRNAAEEQVARSCTSRGSSISYRGNSRQNIAGSRGELIRVLSNQEEEVGIFTDLPEEDVIILPEHEIINRSPVEDDSIHELERFIVDSFYFDDGEPIRLVDVFGESKKGEKEVLEEDQ